MSLPDQSFRLSEVVEDLMDGLNAKYAAKIAVRFAAVWGEQKD